MSVQAAQLIAVVEAQGVDTTEAALQSVGDAATQVAGRFAEMASQVAASGEEVAASGEEASSGFLSSIGNIGGGLLDMANKVGMTVFSLQNIWNVAGQLGSALLGPAISAQQMAMSFNNLMGSTKAAKDELQQLTDFANNRTPFKAVDVEQLAAKMLGFGINAKNVIPYLTAIGDNLAAIGEATPARMQMITDIFGKMNNEGKLSVGIMTELSRDGIDAWGSLERATGKSQSQLQQMISAGLIPAKDAMKLLTQGIEDNPIYKGQMQQQMGTMGGLLSTLSSVWNTLMVSFGSPIIKSLQGSLGNLNNILGSDSFKAFAGGIGQKIADVFRDIGKFVSSAAGPVGQFAGAIELVGKTVANNLAPAFSTLQSIFKPFTGVFSQLTDLFPKAHSGMKSFSDTLGPLTPIFKSIMDASKSFGDTLTGLGKNAAVMGFVNSLKDGFSQVQKIIGGQLGQDFQTFGKTVQDVGKWFQTSMLPAIQQAMPGFLHLGSVIATTVVPSLAKIWAVGQQVARDVMPPLIKAFETVAPIVVKVGGFLADNLGKALQFIAPFAVQAAQTLGQFASEIMSRVAPMVQNMWNTLSTFLNWIKPYWPSIWNGIQASFTMVWDTIKGVIQIAWSIVSGTIKVGLDILSGNWKKAWDDIKSALSGVWDGIKSIVSGAWALVSAPITNGLHTLENTWNTIWNNIKSTFSNVWNSMQGLASGAWNGIAGAIKGGINNVIGMINGFINNLDSIHISLPGGGSVGFSIPDIPYLASGGAIVQGGLAVVGEQGPELMYMPAGAQVIPNTQSFAPAPSVSDRPIILVIDGRVMARGMMPHVVNEIRNSVGVRF